jgi:peptide methionine sulfoxide reductase msrA/msrB
MQLRSEQTLRRLFSVLWLSVLSVSQVVAAWQKPASEDKTTSPSPQTAVFAAGCFWSVETDFERAPGVLDVVSGYTGGRTKNPTYKTYSLGGHREAVLITYDPKEITYAGLCEFLIKHSNPIDKGGAFVDRGSNYAPAIYYATDEEKKIAEGVIKKIDAMKVFRSSINLPVVKRGVFYPAEAFHQDYHHKNPAGYGAYRAGCGRDEFILKHWGEKADFLSLKGSFPELDLEKELDKVADEHVALFTTWAEFKKPTPAALKKKLTKIQFQVTQEQATEKAFENPLWNEKGAGVYVDIVSGEPLFSSRDKVEAKEGWPVFSQSIVPGAVEAHKVGTKLASYIEVRSRYADSYLGQLINTPAGAGAAPQKRYTINGAALKFIPLDQMEEAGYGEFTGFVSLADEPQK